MDYRQYYENIICDIVPIDAKYLDLDEIYDYIEIKWIKLIDAVVAARGNESVECAFTLGMELEEVGLRYWWGLLDMFDWMIEIHDYNRFEGNQDYLDSLYENVLRGATPQIDPEASMAD